METKGIATSNKKEKISYLPTYFIFANLPLKSTKKKEAVYVKTYGKTFNVSITMRGPEGLPGGRYARLLLAMFTTEVVLQKKTAEQNSILLTYKSARQILSILELPTSRTKEVVEQIERFAQCNMTIEIGSKSIVTEGNISTIQEWVGKDITPGEKAAYKKYKNIRFFKEYARMDVGTKGEAVGIRIEFSEEFTEMARTHAIPINYRIFKSIEAPLGKDLYCWFVYKNNANIPQEGVFVTKKQLLEQFAETGKNENQKYEWIKNEIIKIKTEHYPELNVTFGEGNTGILIKKSKSVIGKNDIGYIPMVYEV